mmetsp:Transcript_6605/g.27394  ORF Transcript_6605/g.27394 Transcript_6605/m.27394 type:complete len:393 (+) Transcript_6605:1964-3142(+)
MLEHHADPRAQLGQVGLGISDGDAVDDDVALLEGLQRIDGLDQRRFARARGPADDDDLALADGGGAVGQHLEAAVPLGDVFDVDHGGSLSNDGDLLLQLAHKARQAEADDEVDDGGDQIGFDRAVEVLARDLEALEQVVLADRIDQRGVLEQDDGLGQQHRKHIPEGLRQHDQAHALAVGHAQRIAGMDLAPGHRLDARAHDLGVVAGLEQCEGDEGRHLPAQRPQQLGDQQEEPQDHHHQRDGAQRVDVEGRRHRQPFVAGQPHHRQQGAQQDAADHGDHGQLDGEPEALGDEALDDGPVQEGIVEVQHHFAPTVPGMRTRASMNLATRLIANAEMKYSSVTGMKISSKCEVSSDACWANCASSGMLTANATAEFLTMFMLSLVNGGITMR